MTRIAIVTDSTCDLSPEVRAQFGITMVPLNVHFGEESLRDQIDLTSDEFMERLQRSRELPKTSQPSVGLFEETFRSVAEDHDAIIAVLISSKLSGTVQSATVAAESLINETPVEIVDSRNVSLGLGFQVIRAAELVAGGLNLTEVASEIRADTARYHLAFLVDTLEYLQRGGRIGRAASLVGTVLHLKPILGIEEGQVVPYERTRTKWKAIEGLAQFARGFPQISRLGVLYSTDAGEVDQLEARLLGVQATHGRVRAQFSPVIGTHVGPGALGICVYTGEGP
ncbi:MAG: DegV family protein [Thermomicrobiales bacterium]